MDNEHKEHGTEHSFHTETRSEEITKTEEPTKARDFASKALVTGLVVVFIVVGSYGIIKVIPSVMSSLASISVSVSSIFKPKTVASPTPTPAIETTPSPTPANNVAYPYPSPEAPTPIPTPVNTNYGLADLEVRVLATGVIDRTTNVFTARQNISLGERAAVRFEVINNGTNQSGAWSFGALLPLE